MRKLETLTLKDALRNMTLGETCLAPDGFEPTSIRCTCYQLSKENLSYRTYLKDGLLYITRVG